MENESRGGGDGGSRGLQGAGDGTDEKELGPGCGVQEGKGFSVRHSSGTRGRSLVCSEDGLRAWDQPHPATSGHRAWGSHGHDGARRPRLTTTDQTRVYAMFTHSLICSGLYLPGARTAGIQRNQVFTQR